jgi:photosystem II stability/assembly factor-like uncharacterized protein
MRDQTHDRSQPPLDFEAPTSHHPDTPGKYISTLLRLTAILLAATLAAHAQWDIEESHTTASLRGIHNVGGGVAWASGTNGTVLRTEDGGYLWQTCAIPPGAENLDFRGIQAFDENTAIVMSSGPGDQSRLYKTTDGCQTWKLLFTNPDKQGFWDAINFNIGEDGGASTNRWGTLIGDPVDGKFAEFGTANAGDHWERYIESTSTPAREGESLFAASNSSLLYLRGGTIFVTGGKSGSRSRTTQEDVKHDPRVSWNFIGGDIPLGSGEASGAFSVATSTSPHAPPAKNGYHNLVSVIGPSDVFVAVGGNYTKPDRSQETAAWSSDGTKTWHPAQTPPHGYRSSVAYDPTQKLWITVGPNGTDISRDDGRNWRVLKPSNQDPADADKNWNALSLPFVVGPNGRIGKLRTIAPAPSAPKP